MNASELFVAAVQTAEDLLVAQREQAGAVVGLEEHTFDASYIAFLDSQISLNARGPEWTAASPARGIAPLLRRHALTRTSACRTAQLHR